MDKETREYLKREIDRKRRKKIAKLEKDKKGEVDLNTLRENEGRGEWPPVLDPRISHSAGAHHRVKMRNAKIGSVSRYYRLMVF